MTFIERLLGKRRPENRGNNFEIESIKEPNDDIIKKYLSGDVQNSLLTPIKDDQNPQGISRLQFNYSETQDIKIITCSTYGGGFDGNQNSILNNINRLLLNPELLLKTIFIDDNHNKNGPCNVSVFYLDEQQTYHQIMFCNMVFDQQQSWLFTSNSSITSSPYKPVYTQ